MVCASNMNRSMEAHKMLKQHGFDVESYGVGTQVKIPGPTQDQPNVYAFGTPYNHILRELEERDKELYTRNGLLKMLERNVGVKEAPQKWQENSEVFDVVLCFEERVFDVLVEDLNGRDSVKGEAVLVINMNVKDNHEEAAVGADDALHLCEMLQAVDDWEDCVEQVLENFETLSGRKPLYTICFY